MKSIKESLLNSLNESKFTNALSGRMHVAIDAIDKLQHSDGEWDAMSIYNLWMKSEEVADDEEAFDEWYESTDLKEVLSYDEARILMMALAESYNYLILDLRGKRLNYKTKGRPDQDMSNFINNLLSWAN